MLAADQLLYGRVEADYSPRRVDGYQVVYRSAGVTEPEVRAVEAAVKAFAPAEAGDVRLQFFWLPTGRCALTHSVAIDPHPEYVDHNQRGGAFLAHCLVLSEAEFREHLLANPFRVFDARPRPFFTRAEDMIRELGGRFADAPKRELEVAAPDEGRIAAARDAWGAHDDDLKTFAAEVLAPALFGARRGGGLLIEGTPEHAADLIRLLFALNKDDAVRKAHTFDTLVPPGKVGDATYWAVGTARAPSDGGSARVRLDGETKTVTAGGKNQLPKRFYLWLTAALEAGRPRDEVFEVLGNMARAVELFEGGAARPAEPGAAGEPPGPIPAVAFREYYALFGDEVRADLKARLKAALPPALAGGVAEQLAEYGLPRGERPWWRDKPVPVVELAAWVTSWVAAKQPRLGWAERKAVRALGAAAGAWPLVFWGAVLGAFPRRRTRDRALAAMPPGSEPFAAALRLLGRGVPPAEFVTREHADAVARAAAEAPVTEGELLALATAVVAAGRGDALGPLAGRVAGLSHAGLRALEELTADGSADPGFVAAVRDALAAVPPLPAWCASFQ